MTHGEKAKAKEAKSSQASGKTKSSSKAESGKKADAQKAGESSKAVKTSPEKSSGKAGGKAGGKESVAPTPKKAAGPIKEAGGNNGKTKARAATDSDGFSNPTIASAFKHAVKKYPNAFRKLTD